MTGILIVDDDSLIRESLKILLELHEDMEVIATGKNGQEALEIVRSNNIDLILMDIRMPIMDGVQATKEIKAIREDIKIIILTTFKDDEYIKEALSHGAEGYILKNQSSDSIVEVIRSVLKGNTVYQKEVMNSLTEILQTRESDEKIDIDLTEKERQIMALVGQGYSNKEIASELFLGEGTVRNYITRLLDKLELRDRTQLAIFYLKHVSE